ncbi:glycosyltransferase family 2 protein [Anaeromyxobacter oryzisoli]|uniref:glycosyltransferase family 2 protein n=1 Tax=Anaeromyxobacter oryzisoli TaxID=2925408 RepID=UPI001F578A0C|nr:glycosyltransferase [Anaeromyxobacter sp. SG63]
MTLLHAVEIVEWVFLAYFVALNLSYLALNLVSLGVIKRDADARASLLLPRFFSQLEPPVSVIVPAFNEEATIAGTIRCLLQLEYPELEIVVVNDGSTDGTLDVLVRELDLVRFPEAYRVSVPSTPVRGVYRSLRHRNVRVLDKENGGKADAMNAGINAARYPLFCAVDGDSVLQRDSLTRVVRPFLEDPTTIACGGTIRVVNGCRVVDGFMEEVGLPRGWVARVQVIEYLRAFLFGRLGWAPLNALPNVSGAFGVFRRTAVIAAGGYRTDTVGEDMELVLRLHRLHHLEGRPYRISFVPDPICWTEVPETLRGLRAQRIRWHRGLLESLVCNWRLLLHPRGGAAGWLTAPNLVVFEALGPLVEVTGYVVMAAAFALGVVAWGSFAAFLAAAFGVGALLSANALFLEERSFHVYRRPQHLATLLAAILVENLGYRQLTAFWRVAGMVNWMFRRPIAWGAPPADAPPAHDGTTLAGGDPTGTP